MWIDTELTVIQQTSRIHNHNINHVAIAVDSLDKAVEWYSKHFGFRRIAPEMTIDRSKDGDDAKAFRIYGDQLNKARIAFLTAGNGVGFEIFEFIDPPTVPAEKLKENWSLQQQHRRGGVFHIAVTASDPDALAKEACEDGAMMIGEAVSPADGERAVYLRDPWGMVVEVISSSFEHLIAYRE